MFARVLQLLLCVLLAGPLVAPGWALARPETRVEGSPAFSSTFVSPSASQVAESHQENTACVYDFALGVRIYLYAHNNPVNGKDPSGNSFLLDILLSTTLRTIKATPYLHKVYRGYQVYTRIEDAVDVGKAIFWTGAIAVTILADANAHAGVVDDNGEEFAAEVGDDFQYQQASLGPVGVAIGGAALWTYLERLFTQVHHIASPKQKVGPWTPQFEALFKQAGMTLEDAANKVNVLGHEGPHPQDYHKEVYRRLTEAVKKEKPGSAQFKAALVKELKLLAKDCATWGKPLNQMIVKGIFRKR